MLVPHHRKRKRRSRDVLGGPRSIGVSQKSGRDDGAVPRAAARLRPLGDALLSLAANRGAFGSETDIRQFMTYRRGAEGAEILGHR